MSRSTEITEIRIIKIIGVRIINTLRNGSGIFMDGLLMMLVSKYFDARKRLALGRSPKVFPTAFC